MIFSCGILSMKLMVNVYSNGLFQHNAVEPETDLLTRPFSLRCPSSPSLEFLSFIIKSSYILCYPVVSSYSLPLIVYCLLFFSIISSLHSSCPLLFSFVLLNILPLSAFLLLRPSFIPFSIPFFNTRLLISKLAYTHL